MRTKKALGLEIIPPKNTSGDFPTPENCPKMHQVCVAVGKRQSGKTTAVVNLVERMGFDYTICVSPTMKSNKELMDRLKIRHVIENVDDPNLVDQIKKIVEDEAADLERYREELRRYQKLIRAINTDHMPIDESDMVAFFNAESLSFMKPKHQWGGRKPKIACVFDDCLGSGLYSKPRKLNGLSTYSRHVGQLVGGGSIGISLFFMIQAYKCQTAGLNKVIRNQATSLIIFPTKDNAEKMDIASSVGGEISKEVFFEVYDHAIGSGMNHEFLFIDLHPKKTHASHFRRRFDEFIIIPKK